MYVEKFGPKTISMRGSCVKVASGLLCFRCRVTLAQGNYRWGIKGFYKASIRYKDPL